MLQSIDKIDKKASGLKVRKDKIGSKKTKSITKIDNGSAIRTKSIKIA